MQASTADASLRFLVLAALALVATLVATLVTIRRNDWLDPTPVVPPGSGESMLRIDQPTGYFEREGFVLLEPPIRLPGRASGRNRTEVFLRIPAKAYLEPEEKEGRMEFRLPPGSRAARVESVLRKVENQEIWSVADVRAIRVEEGGEWFQVYRPVSSEPGAALLGVEWRRGDAEAQRRADDWIASAARWSVSREVSERAAKKARADNACGHCHLPFRPAAEFVGQSGSVHRGTDASGLFVPRTILSDSAPLEFYAPEQRNLGDPSISVLCPESGSIPSWHGAGRRKRPICSDNEVPWAHWNAAEAVRRNQAHARAVCASRWELLRWIPPPERQTFAPFVDVCDFLKEP